MRITKDQYVALIKEKPWNQIKEVFKHIEPSVITKLSTLEINPEDWIQWTVDNIDLAQEKWECPKPHYSELSNQLATINSSLGRSEHNTAEFNFGMVGDSNAQLIALLGRDNIEKLGLHPDYILIRLLVKMPGHGVAWHFDDAGSFTTKFPELVFGPDRTCEFGKPVRIWFPVTNWENGFAMQVNNNVITKWSAGDTYIIPWGHGHASSNFGYEPQYTVSLTGFIND